MTLNHLANRREPPGETGETVDSGLGAVSLSGIDTQAKQSCETCGRHTAGTFRSRPLGRGLKNRRRSPVRVFATLHLTLLGYMSFLPGLRRRSVWSIVASIDRRRGVTVVKLIK